jgi:hypothetical protein
MTHQAYTPYTPPRSGRRYRFNILRVLLCSVLMAALVAACLYLYHSAFDFYHARMLENQSKTFAWFVEQLGFFLPLIVICLFHYTVYHRHDRRDGVAAREMLWEMIFLTVLVYGVIYPYMSDISEALHINAVAAGEKIPKNDGKVEITLIMTLHEWFVRLSVSLLALMLYYAARIRRERRFPETEIPEPVITKAEYDARKAAETALAEEADAETEPVTETVTNAVADTVTDSVTHTPPHQEGGIPHA